MAEEDIQKVARSAEEAVTYPILTSEVGYSQGSGGSAGVMPGAAPLGAIAENAIRQVLGWRPRYDDPKSFVAALTQSFELADNDGHIEWKFTPRGYAVQAELGAVTGAQASLFLRAKDTVARCLRLITALSPLRVDADEELRMSTVSIIRQALQELLEEFGLVGGPRRQRVDGLFDLLLGEGNKPTFPENLIPGSQLWLMSERFGLKRERINTIEEEQNFTNFLIIADDVISLLRAWESWKQSQTTEPFLGTQMVLLSRQLAVIAESVQEAYFAMDSVFLRDAERQVTVLDFATKLGNDFAKETPLTVEELLDWIDGFASTEGPRMIQDSGKDGVVAFASLVKRLVKLARGTKEICLGLPGNPTRAFHTARVLNCWDELSTHLRSADQLASQIKQTIDNQAVGAVGAAKSSVNVLARDNGAVFSNLLASAPPLESIRAVANNAASSVSTLNTRLGTVSQDLDTHIGAVSQTLNLSIANIGENIQQIQQLLQQKQDKLVMALDSAVAENIVGRKFKLTLTGKHLDLAKQMWIDGKKYPIKGTVTDNLIEVILNPREFIGKHKVYLVSVFGQQSAEQPFEVSASKVGS